jgi:MFS family permease
VLVERRAEDPVVPLDLFSERIIAVSALGNVAMGGVLLGVSVYVPLFVQGALGGTAIMAGAAVASLSIGWPVGSFVGGRLILLTGYRTTLLLGSALLALGSALCVPMDSGTSLSYVVMAVVVIGLGLGFSSTSYLVSVQNAVPWRRRGVATSSVVFFRTVGGLIGVAVMGAFLNASLGDRYRAAVDRAAGGDPDLGHLLSDPNSLLQPAVRSRIPEGAYSEVAGALAASLSPAFWVLLFFGLSALAVATFFPRGTAKELVSREEGYG